MFRIIILAAIFGAAFFCPIVILAVSLCNFIVVAAKNLFLTFFSTRNYALPKISEAKRPEPFISVHLAICNEPPELVHNALLALNRQNYKNFEVLVLDNNTQDSDVWKPVQKFCKNLGKKFKFYHIRELDGYKAGALNWLLNATATKAELVAVIDADYEIAPDFLSVASGYFFQNNIAFVQLPQAYKNISKNNKGLVLEYEYFFASYMEMGERFKCVNATGSLGVFKKEVLKSLGGFNTSSITEDADLGTRIALAGYRGMYVPKIIGRGLMPFTLSDFKKQRNRWAVGNAQVIKKYFWKVIFSHNLKWKQKMALLAQLTAWANFTFPAILTIIVLSILRIYSFTNPVLEIAFVVCFITILVYLVLKLLSFYLTFRDRQPLFYILRAFFIHISMNFIYSIHYFKGLSGLNFHFVRTNKFLSKTAGRISEPIFGEMALAIFVLILGLWFVLSGEYLYSAAMLAISLIALPILVAFKEITITKRVSEKLFDSTDSRVR